MPNPNKVDTEYIKMAMACVRIDIMKKYIQSRLEERCPLDTKQILNIIASAKKELSQEEYKMRENAVIAAINLS